LGWYGHREPLHYGRMNEAAWWLQQRAEKLPQKVHGSAPLLALHQVASSLQVIW
jgi:hypothetical protein